VVTRDVPPFSIVAGVPARVLRKRQGGKEQHCPSGY
jgi:acetyltransferase-like isoleucine patch superfamily enzyme